jgi:predicted GNAT family N-acyltransferase
MSWISSEFSDEHQTETFDCGKPSLNEWLRDQALRAQGAGISRTFVWTTADDRRVVAYYSVAPTQVEKHEVSRSHSSGFSVVPSYLLARLALDRSLHGQRLGGQLLLDALENIVHAATYGGGRLIVVDALDAAAANFYRHFNFQQVKGNQNRLVLKVATAATYFPDLGQRP